jgi:D-alanyl-D-alanine dipeptidase
MKKNGVAILIVAILYICSACSSVTPGSSEPAESSTASAAVDLESPSPSAAVTPEISTPAPISTPSVEPQATATPAAPEPYEVTGKLVFFRSSPKIDPDNIIALIPKGMRVLKLDDPGNSFVHVQAPDGREGYCSADYLKPAAAGDIPKAVAYAYVTPSKEKTKDSKGNDVTLTDNLVDVRKVDPTIQIYMIFATDKNFTGKVLYPKDYCLLQDGTAAKLKKAQALFQKDGYCIKIYDAYRPASVQKILWDIIKDTRYIANPSAGGSAHNRGAAVDMTLVDKNGKELEMPSPMHTMNETANRNYKGMTKAAKINMDYMAKIMTKCGFATISTEWWHFQDKEVAKYMMTDYDFSKIYPIYEYVQN